MKIFNYSFDEQERSGSISPIDILDPFNHILVSLLKKYVFTNDNSGNIIPIASLAVDTDGNKVYYNDGKDFIERNENSINGCPVFLLSLYCFYNFHLLFDDEDGVETEDIDLVVDMGTESVQDIDEIFAINSSKAITSTQKSHFFKDKLRYSIDLLPDDVQPDELLFPWISIAKESRYSSRKLSFKELKVIDNLVFMSKNLLQDLIYLKLIENDPSKLGLKSFLLQFDSFYKNDFIQKLLSNNNTKLTRMSEFENGTENTVTDKLLLADTEKKNVGAKSPRSSNMGEIDADKEDNSSMEPELNAKTSHMKQTESSNHTDLPKSETGNTADESFQKLILQELNIIKQTMLQEFQNIKFQYSLQQQHLIRLEQQIQLQPTTNNSMNNSNNNNTGFISSAKFSPFINNSPSLNHILSNNPPNTTNTTLQMLKNATQQQQQFNQNGHKSSINSPGGLALLSKIASPQPPMSTNGISSIIPHSSTSNNNLHQTGAMNDKLPLLHESLKMQPTFSEIISDLSNPTPNGRNKSISQNNSENIYMKKRKLNPRTDETNNGLDLELNSMMHMGIEDSPSLNTQTPNERNAVNILPKVSTKDEHDEDSDAHNNSFSNNLSSQSKFKHDENDNMDMVETKKSSQSVKYKIYRGHKTVFDVCEEWYVGIPREKIFGTNLADRTQAINAKDTGTEEVVKTNNFSNRYLFEVVNKAESDEKNNAIIARCNSVTKGIPRLESIQRLIQQYGWRRWKVTGDSHFFPKRRVVIDYIEDETNTGFKNGRFNIHLDTLENCRKFIIWDLEQFRILNEMSLNNISIMLKNVKKLKSKKVTDGIKKEEDTGGQEVYSALRRQLLGHSNDNLFFSIYDSSDSAVPGQEVVMAVDEYKPIRKLPPEFIDKFCKVNLFCKQ